MKPIDINNIFSLKNNFPNFEAICLQSFQYQYQYSGVYRQWCDTLTINPNSVASLKTIPALPISFFKSHQVVSGTFVPEAVFESSGTGLTTTSKHFVKDLSIYTKSFLTAFQLFYGDIKQYCVLGLLPSYLERNNSSLVLMVNQLIQLSGHPSSGFYLNEHQSLAEKLYCLEESGQPTLLMGVSFGLLDFVEKYPTKLKHTLVMETGGMKGRREELTREALHQALSKGFGISEIHSEYGMTELLSQAYAKSAGRFVCPPWMKVLVRNEDDPMQISYTGVGLLQIIDLANQHSCCFIATDDVGCVFEDGSFEVWGRLDHSDLRGCSLMVS